VDENPQMACLKMVFFPYTSEWSLSVKGTRFLGIYTAFRQTQFENPENTEQETGASGLKCCQQWFEK